MSSAPPPVQVSNPTGDLAPATAADLDERLALSLRLIDAVYDRDDRLVQHLVLEEHAECWVQDAQGWTALHAAAHTGSVDHIKLLLRKGNAVWSIPDNLGCTAGDIAFSMNNTDAYEELLAEGIRSEMLRAVLEAAHSSSGESDAASDAADDADMTALDASRPDVEAGASAASDSTTAAGAVAQLSTASDNATFLASRLTFTHDSRGQPIALDAEGNGVMMGWESGIMHQTARRMCEPAWGDRRDKSWAELHSEEEGDREKLRVMNVGFGLGIIDTYLQEYHPTQHLVIEPHPDVLAFARENGWYDKPGVRFYEGTWKDYLKALEAGDEEYVGWDGVYFDTYSEHYADLHAFFQTLPDLLSTSPNARFSFFHGLGATSRLLYDVYTSVSEMHLREIGLATDWSEVDVAGEGVGRWEATGASSAGAPGAGAAGARDKRTEGEGEKKYWREEMVGRYRLPLCRLEF
ncbi:uncharacterized protein RHOBADRAFT_53135 [Rhodotorula graminis WP1]|uniref:RMT2 domain-containing protein n=1 Tax=Rhodotorula graminis (strain WP1) TaxID=578459 RepID=A0A194S2Z1_RHOGW|nr:uncharacterized protein RHOBADRAFT_53135 [Rhodotorula graminis WP1]KPV75103.1 hypothetical protein RHOBADRAFT_53135 [Rhodotorula graminis WP1]